MVEVKMEVQMAILLIMETIPTDLVVDVVVIMASQMEVILALLMIHVELFQVTPLLQSLEEDVDMTGILNMINLSRV